MGFEPKITDVGNVRTANNSSSAVLQQNYLFFVSYQIIDRTRSVTNEIFVSFTWNNHDAMALSEQLWHVDLYWCRHSPLAGVTFTQRNIKSFWHLHNTTLHDSDVWQI